MTTSDDNDRIEAQTFFGKDVAESIDIVDRLRWLAEVCVPGSSWYLTMTNAIAEIERLREKVRLARMLSARLHLIHDDGRYVSVWTLSANAGRPYNGPTYEAELAALDAVLTPEERQP